MQFGIIFSVTDTWMCQMSFFQYGMVVDGENYCPRPELARQFSVTCGTKRKFAEVNASLVLNFGD